MMMFVHGLFMLLNVFKLQNTLMDFKTTNTSSGKQNQIPGEIPSGNQASSVDSQKPQPNSAAPAPVIIEGTGLTIAQVAQVAYHNAPVRLTDNEQIVKRIQASYEYIVRAVERGEPIYGVTTGFGGMANVLISQEEATELQNNAIRLHKTGAGKRLPVSDVRSAMLLRINSHAQGCSGLRLELIERMALFLNAGVTPQVPEFGSIGASGDLVPLTYITGAIIGLSDQFAVDFAGEETDALTALKRLGLEPIRLQPKEGLAMINGTSVMTGIAANCVYNSQTLITLALGVHALYLQALRGTNQSFHPFIHHHKPHPGQIWVAEQILYLIEGSALIRNELNGQHDHREQDLIQDRYSLRCLPQYMGPIIDGVSQIAGQVETEMNSASDNPLIDVDRQVSYHGGNFLGQYMGVGMDQLRYYLGLTAKHLDAQIALLVSPPFNNGLPPSLVGNTERHVNMGLKGLQLAGNAIMPLLTYLGNSLADRFPTHAEQFNQNINSQGFGSANLARQSVETMQQYMAIALLFGIQAVDLRTRLTVGHYDARVCLSPASRQLYEAVKRVLGVPFSEDRPYIWNDNEQFLDNHILKIVVDITGGGQIPQSLHEIQIR